MLCALLLIIPVGKLEDENESIAFLSPYLGRHQTNQNVERTEQKIITNKRQNQISALKSRACADLIQLCPYRVYLSLIMLYEQASMVGVSNSLWNYPSRPMFVLVAICSLAMC